jgi:hypothetical protein
MGLPVRSVRTKARSHFHGVEMSTAGLILSRTVMLALT